MDAVAAAVRDILAEDAEIGGMGRMGLMGGVGLAAPLPTKKFN